MSHKQTTEHQYESLPMVIFGEDWNAHPSSTQHLARELSKFHDITWFNSIGLRAPRLTLSDLGRVATKGAAMLNRFRRVSATEANYQDPLTKRSPKDWQPSVIDPIALPFHGRRWARWLNQKLLSRRLFSVRRDLQQKQTLLWLSLPSAECALGNMNDCFSIYYCGDDFTALEGVDHAVMAELEAKLVARVDLIIVASEALRQKFPAEKTLYIPHGVADYFFEAPNERPADLPQGPIAGFYGSISSWLDQRLLLATARQMPDWQFVLIGRVACDISLLEGQSNIHFLGEKEHQQLPDYVHHWQVSLLPFLDNAQIRACNPLKLREYMAIGKPIVSTRFPALTGYEEWLHVVDNDDAEVLAHRAGAFAAAITQAAANLPGLDRVLVEKTNLTFFNTIRDWQDIERLQRNNQQRSQRVQGESWRARAMLIYREIHRRQQLAAARGCQCD